MQDSGDNQSVVAIPIIPVWFTSTTPTGPDNNLVENAIRPFLLGRKNWLFSGHPSGAKASAAMYSLIETAKANGLKSCFYLRYLFEKLPMVKTESDLKNLLPQYVDTAFLGTSIQ